MNGVHDMGGMHGMGPIDYEKNEPVFHQPWESRGRFRADARDERVAEMARGCLPSPKGADSGGRISAHELFTRNGSRRWSNSCSRAA